MLTVKCKTYTTEELNLLYCVLNDGIVKLHSMNCNHDCQNCTCKRLCIDLQSATLFVDDVIKAGR